MLKRRVDYASHVKQVYLPAKSDKKERELADLRSRLHHPIRNTNYPKVSRSMGNDKREYARNPQAYKDQL
jgi:hypothetical protein|tara:strand:- start:597 stop:806 length:210 start_codon:yes stop_codon:yes gene_type:complete